MGIRTLGWVIYTKERRQSGLRTITHTPKGLSKHPGKGKDEEGDGGADKPLMCVDAYCIDIYLIAETWVMR